MLKRICLTLSVLAMTMVMSGCFHQQVVVDTNYNASKTVPDYQTMYFHIIGLVGINNKVALNEVCPGGAGIVENKTFVNIYGVTFQQLSVYCK